MKKMALFLFLMFVQFSFGQITTNWGYDVGSSVRPQSPAIAADGTIYIGSENNTSFHAVNPDNTLKWTYTGFADNTYSSASIGADGTIYIGSKDDFLHAINPADGSQKWKTEIATSSSIIYTTPSIANDGTIYIGSDVDKFYAINPSDGSIKWTFTTSGFNIRSTAGIANDGTVYIASDDNNLYAINPTTGIANWSFDVGGDVEGAISIGSDGTIYVGVDQGGTAGAVYAVNPDGTQKWERLLPLTRLFTSPVVANGNLYFGTKETDALKVINESDGTDVWEYVVGGDVNSTPAIGNDGKVYFGSHDNSLYCLNSDGTLHSSIAFTDTVWSSPAINGGTLYVGCYNGFLYSVDIPSTGLADSDYPMFSGNMQHTGKAPVTWDGSVDTDWAKPANWGGNTVPVSGHDVMIPNLTNAPIIGSSTDALAHKLTITEPDGVTISSGGTLIVNGASTGNVTYNRELTAVAGNTNGWHLVSSPIAGQAYNNAFAATNDLATSGTKRGFATYNDANASGSKYTYLENDDSNTGIFTSASGIGYSAKRASTGDISFTGTINTADVLTSSLPVGFHLLGNPYTSYVSSQTLLNDNANLDQSQIWVWKQGVTGGNFITMTAKADNFVLAPSQGFFVKVNSGSTVNFAKSNQANSGNVFQKTAKTEIRLLISDGESNRFAKFYYLDNVTKGFDVGYEGETFGGIKNSFDIFSQLVEENQGKNYQVQSLPKSNFENMVIPIGVIAEVGKEITFSVESLNLPSDIKVFLEDRVTTNFTRLDNGGNYKITLTEFLNDVGRFYVHTSSTALSVDDNLNLESISVFKSDANTLKLVGLPNGKSNIKLFNILGKQVLNTSFKANGVEEVSLPKLVNGVYIVQLETDSGKLNKKIVLE